MKKIFIIFVMIMIGSIWVHEFYLYGYSYNLIHYSESEVQNFRFPFGDGEKLTLYLILFSFASFCMTSSIFILYKLSKRTNRLVIYFIITILLHSSLIFTGVYDYYTIISHYNWFTAPRDSCNDTLYIGNLFFSVMLFLFFICIDMRIKNIVDRNQK